LATGLSRTGLSGAHLIFCAVVPISLTSRFNGLTEAAKNLNSFDVFSILPAAGLLSAKVASVENR
jgi:hypothetical protein